MPITVDLEKKLAFKARARENERDRLKKTIAARDRKIKKLEDQMTELPICLERIKGLCRELEAMTTERNRLEREIEAMRVFLFLFHGKPDQYVFWLNGILKQAAGDAKKYDAIMDPIVATWISRDIELPKPPL